MDWKRASRLALFFGSLGVLTAIGVEFLVLGGALGALGLALLAAAAAAAAGGLLRSGLAGLSPAAFLALVIALAAGSRLLWVSAVANDQVSDFASYHELASALASGQGYAVTGPAGREDLRLYMGREGLSLPYRTSFRPPGTAFLGALLYRALGPNPLWMKLLNVVFGVLTAVLLFKVMARGPVEEARLAGLGWAVYPAAVFATDLFCSEIPFTFALVLMAYLVDLGPRSGPGLRLPALLGLLAGASCLVRPMWAPLILALGGTWLARWGARAAIRGMLVVLAAGALIAGPWAVRNSRLWGRPVGICTDTGIWLGFHTARLLPLRLENDPERQARLARWRASANEAEQNAEGYAWAVRNLAAAALEGPRHLWSRAVPSFGETFGNDDEMLRWSTMSQDWVRVLPRPAWRGLWILNQAFYAALWLLTAASLARRREVWAGLSDGARFLLLNLLLTFAIFAMIPARPRYHFSLMPAVMILASRGAGTLAGAPGARRGLEVSA